jgi:pyridoxal phosphate enzyme (YggS family)
MEWIAARLEDIRARIESAAGRVGRDPADVELLPVTKGHSLDTVQAVVAAGFERIGENRVDEAEAKQSELGGRGDVAWHMIGHLQGNKARRALELFDVIESVDSVKLARRLSRLVGEGEFDPVDVLVQVNASGEDVKSGLAPEETSGALEKICALPGLRVGGLMTMAPYTGEERVLRTTFRTLRELSERCRDEVSGFEGRTLSMGMSNDFEIAVEEGSTRVRLGTVLLGDR